jgi:predicted transcriptional regulator
MILEYLSDGEWYSSSDVVSEVMEQSGHARPTIHRKLKGMADDGVIQRRGQGEGKTYEVRYVPQDDEPTQLDLP